MSVVDLFGWKPPPPPPPPPPKYPTDHRGQPIPPDICDEFEQTALKISGFGWTHYSSDAIGHRIRWHRHFEKGDRAFKFNNNWTAPLARWFLALHPEFAGFFELRERIDDGYSVAAE